MSISNIYGSEAIKRLNKLPKSNIECIFYDPGYSNTGVTLATFNRCLDHFRNRSNYSEYTERGNKGKIYNSIIQNYIATYQYEFSNIQEIYNFHINYFIREEQKSLNEPEQKYDRIIKLYTYTTDNNKNNIYFKIINEKEFINGKWNQKLDSYNIIFEYTYITPNPESKQITNIKSKLSEFFHLSKSYLDLYKILVIYIH
jgi:hypothetical protein